MMRMLTGRILTGLLLALVLLHAGAAWGQPRQGQGPEHGGRGQGHQQGQGQGGHGAQGKPHGKAQGQGQAPGQGRGQPGRIADADRGAIHAYFGQMFAQGNCPPGLAKKGNGCQPPGQARRWAVGQRLPAGLGYPLPPDLLRRLAPPAGHTYLRVGTDILLIAAGTGMVVAGVQDLLR